MPKYNYVNDDEYINIVNKYLTDERVKCLENIPHHDSNRLDHSLKVSYMAYTLAKKYNLNKESVAKAGLLHDLYYNRIDEMKSINEKVKLFTNEHPKDAAINASNFFGITKLEENIIKSHMWPLSIHFPRYKESLAVNFADKYYSFKEFGKKWNFELTYNLGVLFLVVTFAVFK